MEKTKSAFSKRQEKTYLAFAEVVIPRGGPMELGAADMPLIEFVSGVLSYAEAATKLGLKAGLFFLEFIAPLIYIYRLRTFSSLAPADRDRVLIKIKGSFVYAIRGIYLALNAFVQMCFYTDVRVMDTIGFLGYRQGVRKAVK